MNIPTIQVDSATEAVGLVNGALMLREGKLENDEMIQLLKTAQEQVGVYQSILGCCFIASSSVRVLAKSTERTPREILELLSLQYDDVSDPELMTSIFVSEITAFIVGDPQHEVTPISPFATKVIEHSSDTMGLNYLSEFVSFAADGVELFAELSDLSKYEILQEFARNLSAAPQES